MLTGESVVDAEEKYLQLPKNFKNYAKIVFSANQLPSVPDDSNAWWRRQVMVELHNQIAPEKRDPHLITKLTTDKELSGLLNIALRGLRRLTGQGRFSFKPSLKQVASTYKKLSDSVKAFVDECCVLSPSEVIAKDELYSLYRQYCDEWKTPRKDVIGFGMKLKQLYPDIESVHKTIEGESKYCYSGINCFAMQLPSRIMLNMTQEEYDAVETEEVKVNG